MQRTIVIGFGLLVASFRTGDTEIFRVDPVTGDSRNLTRSPQSSERYPSWSPDGSLIAFNSDRDGTHNLFLMDGNGRNVRQLTTRRLRSWPGRRAGRLMAVGFTSGSSAMGRRGCAAFARMARSSRSSTGEGSIRPSHPTARRWSMPGKSRGVTASSPPTAMVRMNGNSRPVPTLSPASTPPGRPMGAVYLCIPANPPS